MISRIFKAFGPACDRQEGCEWHNKGSHKKTGARLLAAILTVCLLAGSFPCLPVSKEASHIYGAAKTVETLAGTISASYSLDMWHYSGGYWKVGNSWASAIRFNDSEIDGSIANALVGESANFKASVSQELADLLSGTAGVDYRLEWGRNYEDYYDEYSSGAFPSDGVAVSGTTVSFSLTPRFNISGDTIGDLAGVSTSKAIPVIDEEYGCNIYSIFGNGVSAVQVNGSTYEKEGCIHPQMIKNSKGALKEGYKIRVNGNLVDSGGYSIGNGTFSAAGACGLHFSFPLSVKVYKYESVEVPDQPENPDPAVPSEPEPDQPAEPAKPEVTGLTASLGAPVSTYVGHRTLLHDYSVYRLDGESYGAARALELGLGKNSFSIVQNGAGTISKAGKTKAAAVLSKPGNFTVKLTATAVSGQSDTDTKIIEVKKTPSIAATLGGSQKENRKQILQVSVAQNPASPVNFLGIRIRDKASGEEIAVNKVFGGAEREPQNSANIKYRKPEDGGSDEYFLNVELPFLTKWQSARTLEYLITAEDGAGNKDSLSAEFTVLPDNPPLAKISLEDSYYRSKNSPKADILVQDVSETDGDDLSRSWFVETTGGWTALEGCDGFTDKSFGKKQSVSFKKSGVGAFKLKLMVKDKWVEETLPEYISEADYKWSEAEAESKVDNIPPIVSLDLLKSETASIFILAETPEAKAELDAKTSGIRAALLAEGIDAVISTDSRQPASPDGAIRELITGGSGGRSVRGGSNTMVSNYWTGMWQGGNSYSDDHNAYILTGTYTIYSANTSYSYDDYPYTISSYNSDGTIKWKASVTQAILPSSDYLASATWGRTFGGEYIYLTEGGKTALFSTDTGSYGVTLDCELGSLSLLADEYIYTFKSDGVYRLPRSGGSLEKVYSCGLSCPAYIDGRVQFCFKKALSSGLGLARGVLDPVTGEISCDMLEGSCGSPWASAASFLCLDAAGTIIASSGGKVYCYGRDNSLIREISLTLKPSDTLARVFPVYSFDGRAEYVGESGHSRTGTSSKGYKYHTHCAVQGIFTEETYSETKTTGGDYLNYGYPVIYALRDSGGAIGIYLGGAYIYNSYERYLNSVLFSFNGTFDHKFGFPMEQGKEGLRYVTATANLGGHDDIKQILYLPEDRAAERSRLKNKYLDSHADYCCYFEYSQGDPVSSIVDGVKEAKKQGPEVLKIEAEGSSAKLGTAAELAPDTTWYYEYDTSYKEDVLSLSCRVDRGFSPASGYKVDKEYAEDFDDGELNSFFSADKSGIVGTKYRIGYLYTSKKDSNTLQTGSSRNISFTVPQGKEAVLSFDYDYYCYSTGNYAAYLRISKDGGDSVPWQHSSTDSMNNAEKGTYVHPSVLGPGTYTLSCVIRDYTSSGKHENYFYIDNIKTAYISSGSPSSGAYVPAKQSSLEERGGFNHVKGSFTTPTQTMYYGKYDCEYSNALNSSFSAYVSEASGYSKNVTETITIPSGRKALYANLVLSGNAVRYSSRNYNVYWLLDGSSFAAYYARPSGSDYLYMAPSPFTVVLRNFAGTKTFKSSANSRYGADTGAAGLELFVSKAGAAVPSGISEGKLFVRGSNLYGIAAEYTGNTDLILTAATSGAIRNFRLYTLSGGKKIYAEDYCFKDTEELSNWSATGCKASIGLYNMEKEEPARVYAKGETINYKVFYCDYEGDPSKKQYWVYEHEPMNDGLYSNAGKTLTAPVTKFYVDGKYTLTHWQEDSTGNPACDRESNKVKFSFYIQGEGSSAPWVKYVKTDPPKVESGKNYSIAAAVDDEEKDTLWVRIEVYKDGESKPFAVKTYPSLNADEGGKYPELRFSDLPAATPGTYDVVVTVKDSSGAGLDSLRFKVKETKSLEGEVTHTPEWEANRIIWNEAKKGTPDVRPANMFWPGEALVLKAKSGGKPSYVSAELLEFPRYSVRLTKASDNTDGSENFQGRLWDASMLSTIGTAKPVPATVRFTSVYPDGSKLTKDVKIIFDQSKGSFYQLHRKY